MSRPTIDLNRAAVVVAHPDDEILWFSSLATRVRHIVICYGAISQTSERAVNRRKAIEAYPLPTVTFLDLPIPLGEKANAASSHDPALVERLSEILHDTAIVFTHNPWGEYGQADHQRVHAAVSKLQQQMNFSVYVSGYVARHQLAELECACATGIADSISFPVSYTEIAPIHQLYKSHSCWTWAPNWVWPRREHFLKLGAVGRAEEVWIQLFGGRKKQRAEMRQIWFRLMKTKAKEMRYL